MDFDLIVIGAGPAGMAAAVTASIHGLRTALLDENAGPGGQIYRAITTTPVKKRKILGGDYWFGEQFSASLKRSAVVYKPQTTVWSLQAAADGVEVGILDGEGARLVSARFAIVATGAMERPFPIPGWTLPGVMTVGGAQTLLKASGLVPEGDMIVAGSGPLLYLYTQQLITAGAKPKLLLDTTPKSNWRQAIWHLPSFVTSHYMRKGLSLLATVKRNVPIIRNVSMIRADGDDRAKEVVWQAPTGESRQKVDLLLLHQGVVPTINLWSAAGCKSHWDEAQACWHADVDAWGESSQSTIFIAGDGVGIGGAESASAGGMLAGLQVAHRCGGLDSNSRDRQARPVQQTLASLLRGRDFLDALYRPADWTRLPQGGTIVCRCEEVSAAQIVTAAKQGCSGPNQMKAYLRCGMGPCQGRQCGLTVTELMAQTLGRSPADIGHVRPRPPVKPITLADMAKLPASPDEKASVIRL